MSKCKSNEITKTDAKLQSRKNLITLCHLCLRDYSDTSAFHIKAVFPRLTKDSCAKCGRGGYDYIIKERFKSKT